MAVDEPKGLRFPCECVSGLPGGYSEPWADIAKRKLLPNGTKEQIVTLLAEEPKTISQLAQALNLSAPSVFTHINDMLERLPTISIADVKVGDTIIVSSTQGVDPTRLTAISLVTGADTLLAMLAPRPQAGQAPNPAAGLGGSGISFGIGLP